MAGRVGFFQRAFLFIWAMITLVLVFVLFLLMSEMAQQGRTVLDTSPAETVRQDSQAATAAGASTAPRPSQVALYFTSPSGDGLVAEERELLLGESTVQNCRMLLDALIKGPRDHAPVMPTETQVRGVYLINGTELVIDFTSDLLFGLPRSTSAEALMAYAVVNTVTQNAAAGPEDAPVRSVRFLVDGAPPQESIGQFEGHLNFSVPFSRHADWLPTNERSASRS